LLRFHFSLFLLPVYLFALSQLQAVEWNRAILIFFILHFLVYPSSNGYNSFMDRDKGSIGGLSAPLQPTRQLFITSIVMDVVAILLSFFISWIFALGILLYILASRAYSYRGIRLKKYPITGFLTVFIFQGALIFFITYHGADPERTLNFPWLPCLISSLLIGALYPLTQVYQHEDDSRDGVVTISMLLGKTGSFIFSMILFLTATFLMFILLRDHPGLFYLFLFILLPVVLFFLYWMLKVRKNASAADFRHSLGMNVLSTVCTAVFFITLIILKH
jgi:1,4-dihydroxy-2-naphthoate octaprenyltransferase